MRARYAKAVADEIKAHMENNPNAFLGAEPDEVVLGMLHATIGYLDDHYDEISHVEEFGFHINNAHSQLFLRAEDI